MSDFERRLVDALHEVRDAHTVTFASDVHAIRADMLARLRRRKVVLFASLAAAITAAVVAAAVVVPNLGTEGNSLPQPVGTPTPTETPIVGEEIDCNSIPFRPTYLPEGWTARPRSGSGGFSAPVDEQFPGALGHFSGGQLGRFIDVYNLGSAPYRMVPGSGRSVTVLGSPGKMGNIHEGTQVEFTYLGCNYALENHALSKPELKQFAEGLEPYVPSLGPRRGFAVWPEDTASAALAACAADRSSYQGIRSSWGLEEVAQQFARDLLDWDPGEVVVAEAPRGELSHVYLYREDRDGPMVHLFMREVAPGCWSVYGAESKEYAHGGKLKVSVRRGDEFTIIFDSLGARSVELTIGYDGEPAAAAYFTNPKTLTPISEKLRFTPTTTGHYILLLKDESGSVFGAAAGSLPAGNYGVGYILD